MSVRTLSPDEAMRLVQSGAKLIDVRTPMEFAQVHAKGAVLSPLHEMDPKAELFAGAGTPELPLLVICKSGARSAKACDRLISAGITHVASVAGGTEAWERAGLPIERQAVSMISLERQVRIGAGLLVLSGVLLGWLVHPYWFGLSGFVGAGLAVAGVTNWCGMGLLLARAPWNRSSSAAQ